MSPVRVPASRSTARFAPARLGRLPLSLLMLGMTACGGGNASSPAAEAAWPPSSTLPAAPRTDGSAAAEHPTGNPAGTPAPPTRVGDGTNPDPAGGQVLAPAPGDARPAVPPATDVCQPVLGNLAQRTLPFGPENARIPDQPRPATGIATEEATYPACLVRITANDGGRSAAFLRHDYSRRQAFNADSSLLLLYALDGYWHLYDARSLKHLKRLDGLAGDAEPQWHPTDPGKLHYLNTNGLGMQIHLLDVIRNTSTTVADMGVQVRRRWPSADTAWTRSEGSPSADGRYWCFQAERSRDWQTLGVFTWDMQTGQIIGSLDLDERPDHVSMSPTGSHCVIASDGPMGTRSYTRDFRTPYRPGSSQPWLQLHAKSEHSDIALDADGQDTFVTVDYTRGMVTMTNLHSGQQTPLFPVYPGRTATALHFSGKSYRKPGWVLVSSYAEHHPDDPSRPLRNTTDQQWLHRKLLAVSLSANPQIRPIAHVDSTLHDRRPGSQPADLDPYWAEPQASVNPDFTRMLFNSTWNGQHNRETEAFLVAVPAGALDNTPANHPRQPDGHGQP